MGEPEVDITAVGARSDGVGDYAGTRVYVAGALPGERHRLRLAARDRHGIRGHTRELLLASPERRAPPCPHFGVCGGCSLQQWQDAPYLAWKRERIVEALARVGLGDARVRAARSVPPESRRRARFTAYRRGGRVVVGFHERLRKRVTPIGECPVLRPELARLPGFLTPLMRELLASGAEVEITATAGDRGVDLWIGDDSPLDPDLLARLAEFARAADLARLSWGRDRPETLVERRRPIVRIGGVEVATPAHAFLQATGESEAWMIQLATAHLAGARRIADLFAGLGMLSLPLAAHAQVTAIDQDGEMLAALVAAARGSDRSSRLSVEARDLMRRPLAPAELAGFEAVVFDPPRAGARAQSAALAASTVPRIVALSCNPATFARDARLLVDGGYRLQEVTPIDQFLWSAHVELVACFQRD